MIVSAVNVPERLALRDDDVLGDIRSLLDEDGDETDSADIAVMAIVEWRDGGWSPVDLRDYKTAATS